MKRISVLIVLTLIVACNRPMTNKLSDGRYECQNLIIKIDNDNKLNFSFEYENSGGLATYTELEENIYKIDVGEDSNVLKGAYFIKEEGDKLHLDKTVISLETFKDKEHMAELICSR